MKKINRLKSVTFSGLISHLESRLGLRSGAPRRAWRRWLAYADALEAVETGRSFYRLPFVADRTGVARELLSLRDEMRMAGWNGKPVAGVSILSALSVAERDRASFEGTPDRIERILPLLSEPELPTAISISELPSEPLAFRLVETLEARGVRVEHSPRELAVARADITMLRLTLDLLFTGSSPHELLSLPVSPLPRVLAESLPVGSFAWHSALRKLRADDELLRGKIAHWLEGPTWSVHEGAPRVAVVDVARRVGDWARATGQISLALAAEEVSAYARESRVARYTPAAIRRMLRDCEGAAEEPVLISAEERRALHRQLFAQSL